MATNKHAQIRYLALDKCFSNYGRNFYIDDLVEACSKAIYDHSGIQNGVQKRQVYEDIKFMESEQGYKILLNKFKNGRKTYFRYHDKDFTINNSPLNQVEVHQIQEVLATLFRFKGMPQFEWVDEIRQKLENVNLLSEEKIIDFEQNQFLKGLEFINPLFNAIVNRRVLIIKYMPFKSNEEHDLCLHPYFLKQYNLRWFLFAFNPEYETLSNLALDRIMSIKESGSTYQRNHIDFTEYFEDVIGVTVPENMPVVLVTLAIQPSLWPYIQTKPIHGSQKLISKTQSKVTITLELKINYEFIALLLSFGERIKVVSPPALVSGFKDKLSQILNQYN